MRELKFRAWEKNQKEMIPVHNINFTNKMINTNSAWRTFDEIEIMQWTELLDDLGNEIYEGDIVEVVDGKRRHISAVKIHPTGVIIDSHVFTKNMTGKDTELLYEYSDFGIGRGITQTCMVVGNIYEHPHLLK